ncbi:MAG: anaerobic ribonucleoside-triphosphate reductase activating protein [Chlamydiae bacterium RIFCSPHIGHO2_12_FULL_27_8]|nr:MAG: anaerobic ribonucleoside-triphosphate reductase activating protein [Chlamydiae bacterium RIFCSPHIGHO2_12_FULL_27_8]
MLIGGIQKLTLIDYPKKLAALVFTQGCPFLCHFCHNKSLVLKEDFLPPINEEKFFDFLKSRINKLDAVVISGGEPSIQKDLYAFTKKIKDLNFLVKLDTNGINPDIIQKLLNDNLLDYIAMDIKAPLTKYEALINKKIDLKKIVLSIEIIKNSKIDNEFRSTLIKNFHSIADILEMASLIKEAKKYFLQKFINTNTLNKEYQKFSSFSDDELLNIKNNHLKNFRNVFIR